MRRSDMPDLHSWVGLLDIVYAIYSGEVQDSQLLQSPRTALYLPNQVFVHPGAAVKPEAASCLQHIGQVNKYA